jgi:hypothetical protein
VHAVFLLEEQVQHSQPIAYQHVPHALVDWVCGKETAARLNSSRIRIPNLVKRRELSALCSLDIFEVPPEVKTYKLFLVLKSQFLLAVAAILWPKSLLIRPTVAVSYEGAVTTRAARRDSVLYCFGVRPKAFLNPRSK